MGVKLSERIVDLLDVEGGWWHSTEIAERLKADPRSVDRALYRMRQRQAVVHRRRELSDRYVGGIVAEWSR